MFEEIKFCKVNREERHFGFLLFASIIYDLSFREKFIRKVNIAIGDREYLRSCDLDLYAEVALFRDYWYNLGYHKKYSIELHNKRLDIVKLFLAQFNLRTDLINRYNCFWTKAIGESKLWYPGKWDIRKMKEIQVNEGIIDDKLLRIRWACNAKPDMLIISNNTIVFIELKVESGLGDNAEGYDQRQTQYDIIDLSKQTIPFISSADNIFRLMITPKGDGLNWPDLVCDVSNEIVRSHFDCMPK